MKAYLLTEEEVSSIEKTMGIKLREERSPHPFYPHIQDETYLAIDLLDGGDHTEDTLEALRAQAETMTNEFIENYVVASKYGSNVADAMDQIFEELREFVYLRAEKIEESSL